MSEEDKITRLPIRKKGATAAERLMEAAREAEETPEAYEVLIIISQRRDAATGRVITSLNFGADAMQTDRLLGILEMAKQRIFQ